MSLVAVTERVGDQAGELQKTTVVPVGMPQDVVIGAYFGGSLGSPNATGAFALAQLRALFAAMLRAVRSGFAPVRSRLGWASEVGRLANDLRRAAKSPTDPVKLPLEDALLELARRPEPDGGMPGQDDFERMARSLVASLAFLIKGHTSTAGAFRAHVQRLMHLLEISKFPSLSTQKRDALDATFAWIKEIKKPTRSLPELLSWKVEEDWEQARRILAGGV
jgi:hypothetical protein